MQNFILVNTLSANFDTFFHYVPKKLSSKSVDNHFMSLDHFPVENIYIKWRSTKIPVPNPYPYYSVKKSSEFLVYE